MPVSKKTSKGQIKISDDAIATLAGTTVNESYGIVGVVSRNYIKDGYAVMECNLTYGIHSGSYLLLFQPHNLFYHPY